MLNIIIHGEYSKLFGKPAPSLKQAIPTSISSDLLIILSMISYSNRDKELSGIYINKLSLSKKGRKEINRVKINKRPSNLILWTECLKRNITPFNVREFKFDDNIKQVIEVLTIINEKEAIGKDVSTYLINNQLYTYQDSPLYQHYRAINILLNNEMMDKYILQFEQANNISLKEFIFICHAINSIYIQTKNWSAAQYWVLNIPALCKLKGFDQKKVKIVMDNISFTQEEIQEYARSEDYVNHNFNFFSNNPYYKVADDCYIPVDGKLSQDLVFNNLYHRIKKSCNDKLGFMRDFGKSVEKYATDLINYIASNSKSYNYKYIQEFKYDVPEKRSSDAYLCYKGEMEDTIIVFEIKSARILDNVKRTDGNRDAIERSIKKLTIDPLEQQIKVTSKIIELECHPEITKDKIYYFISISTDNFPLLMGNFTSEIKEPASNLMNIGGLYSFSIEELELLCELTSHNLDWPIPYLLEKYRVEYSDISFKTYLSRLKNKTNFVNTQFEQQVLESQNVLLDYLNSQHITKT